MKWQGTDGLSRGNLLEGVIKGKDVLDYIPLHLSALDREPKLKEWLMEWCGDIGDGVIGEFLTPNQWHTRGHDIDGGHMKTGLFHPCYRTGLYIWAPPPAAADSACEEIRKARLKRNLSTHVLICPRLLAPSWRRHLHRSADLVLEIPAGGSYWKKDMFEPLTLALFLPFVPYRPWQLRGSPSIVKLGDRMQRMWRQGNYSQGIILRKLREQTRVLQNVPQRLVFQMLHCFNNLEVPCERVTK